VVTEITVTFGTDEAYIL